MNFPEALPSDTAQESLVVLKHCLLKTVSNASNRQNSPYVLGSGGGGWLLPQEPVLPRCWLSFPRVIGLWKSKKPHHSEPVLHLALTDMGP